ncbi:hypothetical protein Fcan01_10397 [Folsomia candida]|uniref:Uncharacterized protein n=1 Tax=Folsomia candida TaxID=158441 RepID=A0A226EA41_FOLCA|nr:hypothetical protein Fcan01_10397 [Folsomia candida]
MHFDQFFATNRLKLQLFHFSQTITAYNALQRFAVFSESLYPQCFTWEKSSWKPYPTLKIKLIPWYVMSILLAGLNIVYLFIVVQEILSYEKDPEINIQSGILLLLTICVYSLDMVITALYVGKVNEICFVMGNFQGFRRILRKYGLPSRSEENFEQEYSPSLILLSRFAEYMESHISELRIDPVGGRSRSQGNAFSGV